MKNIGVEKQLTNVINHLNNNGYHVHEFDTSQRNVKDFLDGFDAVVISGISENLMGISGNNSNASIIDASGMTPDDIQRELEIRLT